VGKTTCSLVLAQALAAAGRKVVLLTVDPARRLEVLMTRMESIHPRLSVRKLDVRRRFVSFVQRHSPDEETATSILESRFFPHLSGRLQALHEYVAADLVGQLVEEEEHQHIVVDTPPFAYAIHFLESPARLRRMASLARTLFGDPKAESSSTRREAIRYLSPMLSHGLSFFLGRDFLTELVDFIASFGHLWTTIEQDFAAMDKLFRSQTSYGVVFRPDSHSTDDLMDFLAQAPDWLDISFLIANGLVQVPPMAASRDGGREEQSALVREIGRVPACRMWPQELHDSAGRAAVRTCRLAGTIRANQLKSIERLERRHPRLVEQCMAYLPLAPGGIRTRAGLEDLRRRFFRGSSQ